MTDPEYPERAAFILINTLLMDFREYFKNNPGEYELATSDKNLKFPVMAEYLQKWQNPHEADKLMKIEKELFEVKEIIHQNLSDILKRGEQLDVLMARSKDLSTVSVDFYKKAKKQNQRCCTLN